MCIFAMNLNFKNMSIEENSMVYTVKEVSEKLKVSPRQVYNLVNDGKINSVKVGSAIRILKEEFERYLNQLTKS